MIFFYPFFFAAFKNVYKIPPNFSQLLSKQMKRRIIELEIDKYLWRKSNPLLKNIHNAYPLQRGLTVFKSVKLNSSLLLPVNTAQNKEETL